MTGFALDTNVLAYAEGVAQAASDTAKTALCRRLLKHLADTPSRTIIAVQALAELHNVLVRKRGLSAQRASGAVRGWIPRAELVPSSASTFATALDLATDHNLPIFDAIILAAAAEAGCDVLLSEDFQDGFRWQGVTVVNPFRASPDPRVARLL